MKTEAFTLIEILVVSAIVAFIIGFSYYFYLKFSKSTFVIDESAGLVVNVLNLARQKAIVGEENDSWGVWLINTSTQDYFYLFKGTTSSLRERYQLPREVSFFDFTQKTIVFQKLSGDTTATTIKIGFTPNFFKTIKVSTSGAIIVE
jgi:prepilin-type N-terminal cleavage/methylation domain-containing protein